ncbi:methyltransferase family protein [Sediminivirga luteola]|uniref:methyltransferase family protein n=1 Tax=Sediminivirga luteola TaxID=1774748 RepID=UPI00241241B1|nr:isoprenylcysteine carboxylmethyltransferase family protein [Sediminivirga luteola]
MTSTPPRVPPVAALAASAAAQTLLGTSRPGRARRTLACVLATGSVGLLASSVTRFRQQRTTVNPLNPSEASSLVTSGPNAVSRNPMYVAMAGTLGAHALWRGSLGSWLPVAGFVLWIDRTQIRPEEAALEAQFGQDYTRYKAHVPRWIGLPSTTT